MTMAGALLMLRSLSNAGAIVSGQARKVAGGSVRVPDMKFIM
jgi:hypothetical protein